MGVIELKRKHDAAAVNSSLVRRPIRRWAPLFMGPMLCAFAIGFVYPFCKGVYLSFCKFKTTSDAQFIGFGNYIKALNDASFVHSFWYTALFALVSLVFINVLAFAVAYALTQGIKGSNLFRTVFFMPNLIGGIVLGYVWSMIFDGILSRYNTSTYCFTNSSSSARLTSRRHDISRLARISFDKRISSSASSLPECTILLLSTLKTK